MVRRPRTALLAALACLAGLGVTLVLAYFAPPFGGRDAATLQGFIDLNRPRLTPLLSDVAHLADPAPYGLIGLALVLIALARHRGRVALAIAVVLICSVVTSESLKPLLSHPRPQEWLGKGQIAAASWPSGHATAAMALALCAVLAVPARWRPAAAAAGGLFSLAVAYAILTLGLALPVGRHRRLSRCRALDCRLRSRPCRGWTSSARRAPSPSRSRRWPPALPASSWAPPSPVRC